MVALDDRYQIKNGDGALFVVVCRRFGSSVRSEVVKFQRQCEPVIPKKKKWSASIFHTRSLPSSVGGLCLFVVVCYLYAPLILYGSAQPVHVYTSRRKSDQEQFTKFIPAGMRLTTDFCKRDWVIYISLWTEKFKSTIAFVSWKYFELSWIKTKNHAQKPHNIVPVAPL